MDVKLVAGSIFSLFLMFCSVWFYGEQRVKSIHELTESSPSVKVAIVQGNIDQAKKWDPAFTRTSTLKYIHLSLMTKEHKPDLVVWPETATPFWFMSLPSMSKLVLNGIHDAGTDFLIGSPSVTFGKKKSEHYNSAYLVGPKENVYGKYDKAHLVPFGEYTPLKKWFPFLGKIVTGRDIRPGKKGLTLEWRNYRLGVQICYEIIFPELSRAMTQNNAVLLVNITNDAWFGLSSAPYQHFSMVVFRAVENRRSIIRSANTGISGFIDPSGEVIASTQLFKDATLTRTLPILQETTFYTRCGDVFAVACLGLSLVAVLSTIVYSLFRKYSN